MFDGIKNRFNNLRYGDEKKRRKIFWFLSITIFIIVFIVWILFFAGQSIKIKNKNTGSDFGSIWQAITEKFGSVSDNINQAASQINSVINNTTSTETISASSTDQTTSTEAQTSSTSL